MMDVEVDIWEEKSEGDFAPGWYFRFIKEGRLGFIVYGPYPAREEAKIHADDMLENLL
jgi:hypothetical protein